MDTSNNTATVLIKSILNNVVIRNHIHQYFTKPLGYYLFCNGQLYRNRENMNLSDIIHTKDQPFILDKLCRFRDILENRYSNSRSNDDDGCNQFKTYYQDWLDNDFNLKKKGQVLNTFDNQELVIHVIREISDLFFRKDKEEVASMLYPLIGIKALSEMVLLFVPDIMQKKSGDVISEIHGKRIVHVRNIDPTLSFFCQDIDTYLALRGDVALLQSILFRQTHLPCFDPIDKEMVKLVLSKSNYYNYDLLSAERRSGIFYDQVFGVRIIKRDDPFFYQYSPSGFGSTIMLCVFNEWVPLVIQFLSTNDWVGSGTRIKFIVQEYDAAQQIVSAVKELKLNNKISFLVYSTSQEAIDIVKLLTAAQHDNMYFSPHLAHQIEDLNFFSKEHSHLFDELSKILENPHIKDLIEYGKKLISLGKKSQKRDWLLVGIAMNELEFVKSCQESDSTQQSIADNLLMAYYCHGKNEMYHYLLSLFDAPELEDYLETSQFIIALKKFDLDGVKEIYNEWSRADQIRNLRHHTFIVLLHSIITASTYKDKQRGIQVLEFIKNEAINSDKSRDVFLGINIAWPLTYLVDKELALTALSYCSLGFQNTLLKNMIPGILVANSLDCLKIVIESLTPSELTTLEPQIQPLLSEYLTYAKSPSLKCALYLFERFQHVIHSSILDDLMSSAVRHNNHTLLDILLHRTKIRLIHTASAQQEQELLDRMILRLNLSSHLVKCNYLRANPEFRLTTIPGQTITEKPPNFSISYFSFEFSQTDTLKNANVFQSSYQRYHSIISKFHSI
ncbi:hypothetical protein CYY_005153 [Polysphondylium violaceum]|uniref:Uncharacterized protein n=1 Tax=Polysphondylium violaceum TaxID=133409 RepID=A0A8J4PVK0_9MYCE|nr:hypothetical protein CYY_005153 [Polysphondylium violaceum]